MPYKDPEKQREAQRRHYEKNKASYVASRAAAREKRLRIVAEYKMKPCADCEVEHPYYVMQLDHIKGEKVDKVSALVKSASLGAVLEELEKCDVVCANCHAYRTWSRYSGTNYGMRFL